MNQTNNGPAYILDTNRSMLKTILLSIITLDIYSLIFYSKIGTDLNLIASRYDGKKTMHFCLMFFVLSVLTLGIAPLVWFHRVSKRTGDELKRRGIDYSFGASSFWLWNILGLFILVGPFVYLHKQCKAMNLLCEDYNLRG